MTLIDGKAVSAAVKERIKKEIEEKGLRLSGCNSWQ